MDTKYAIVTGDSPWTLQLAVQDYLNEGWRLVGGPFYGEGRYGQAMVRGSV